MKRQAFNVPQVVRGLVSASKMVAPEVAGSTPAVKYSGEMVGSYMPGGSRLSNCAHTPDWIPSPDEGLEYDMDGIYS